MIRLVVVEYARVVLARLGDAVVAQDGFHIHAEVGVAVATLLLIQFRWRGCGGHCLHDSISFWESP